MPYFVKLVGSILDSSVWLEPDATLRVWLTLLLMADADGEVEAATVGLAARARVSLKDCRVAVATFLAPDHESKDAGFEGRRIEVIPNKGWRILNARKYREFRTKRQVSVAAAVRKHREKKRQEGLAVINVITEIPIGRGTEKETEERKRADNTQLGPFITGQKKKRPMMGVTAFENQEIFPDQSLPETGDSQGGTPGFNAFWKVYPRKVSRAYALRRWTALGKAKPTLGIILAGVARCMESAEWRKGMVPNAATWLNRGGWDDFPSESRAPRPSVAKDLEAAKEKQREEAAWDALRRGEITEDRIKDWGRE